MIKKSSKTLKKVQEWFDFYNKTKDKNEKKMNESLKLWIDLYLAFVDKIILFSSWILSVFSGIYFANLDNININKVLLIWIFSTFLLSIVFGVFIRFFYSKYYFKEGILLFIRDEKKYINLLFWYENSAWVKINSKDYKEMWLWGYKDLEKKEKDIEKNIWWYLYKVELFTRFSIWFFIIWIILMLVLFLTIK